MSTLKKLALTAAAVAVVAYRMKGSKNAPVAAKARTSKPATKAEPKSETTSEPVAAPAKKMSKSKTRRTKAKARAAKHAS
ncbi:hypothetical protein BH11MYX3_BH11MYX3_29590 [soil metagenome]